MRKQWPGTRIGIGITVGLLTACSGSNNGEPQQQPLQQPVVCHGPAVEIFGAEPYYEPLNPSVNQNYKRDGKSYNIVQDPSRFKQTGLAAIYDAEPESNVTASGEPFDPMQLTAAHPTLPIPGYARITNLANGRMIVIRINDRGPYGNDRIISLSRAAADKLNISNNTKVRIDPILVASDGSLSGPGTACTTVAKQTYALPSRPDLNSGMGSASPATVVAAPQGEVRTINNDALQNSRSSVNDNSVAVIPTATVMRPVADKTAVSMQNPGIPTQVQGNSPDTPVTAPGTFQGNIPSATATNATSANKASGSYMLQVGAVSDERRAKAFLEKLTQRYGVPGKITPNGAVYRILLGPFSGRDTASAIQQRLLDDTNQTSFIKTMTP